MEIKNFSGRPIEIITYYVANFEKLDEPTKGNFSDLITAIIKGSDILPLIELHDKLDKISIKANEKDDTLMREMGSREWKIDNASEIKRIADSTGKNESEVASELKTEYQEKHIEHEEQKSVAGMTPGIISLINRSIMGKMEILSPKELASVSSQIADIINQKQSRVDTLALEMTSRRSKLESDNAIKRAAEGARKTEGQMAAELNAEYRERYFENENLEHSIAIYSKYGFTPKSSMKM